MEKENYMYIERATGSVNIILWETSWSCAAPSMLAAKITQGWIEKLELINVATLANKFRIQLGQIKKIAVFRVTLP